MSNTYGSLFIIGLRGLSDVLTAAIALTSFSLFLYSLTFQLHDRITYTFTAILLSVVVIFGADAFAVINLPNETLNWLLHLEWIGIILLPTIYFHFSDALLALTGKPSRGRRRFVGWVCIFTSFLLIGLLFNGNLVGELRITSLPVPALTRTPLSDIFAIYFLILMAMSWYNIARALKRTTSPLSRRRMMYLMIGAIGPAFGAFPFLLYGSGIASTFPLIFWLLSVISNVGVVILTVFMTYAVSFFGFSWPDRVIKRRLLKLVLRGPLTASVTLAITTLINRFGAPLGANVTALTVIGMVSAIILFQFAISILSPIIESKILWGKDREELNIIRGIEDRFLTSSDYVQFQNMLLASLSDRLQAKGGFMSEAIGNKFEIITRFGDLPEEFALIADEFIETLKESSEIAQFLIKNWFVLTLKDENGFGVIGYFAIYGAAITIIDQEQIEPIKRISRRAAQAILDHKAQDALLQSIEMINPRVTVIQQLMAASRYDRREPLAKEIPLTSDDFDDWVRDALSQMWGGPKMTENPLMQLNIIKKRIEKFNESEAVALREVLKNAIQRIKPEGPRAYTNDWIIFNILDLKYLEGWKVKDIARKLALSEADFFRKQRVAFSQVARELVNMENGIKNQGIELPQELDNSDQ